MTKAEFVNLLHIGDDVYWNDPDNGECSKIIYNITNLSLNGDVATVEGHDELGNYSYIECLVDELA